MQLAVLGGSQLLGGGFLKLALFGASVAGSILLKGKQKPVGKLNDLRVSSASYGRGIPHVWGTMRVTGNMFWATDFREEKVYVTQKGKQKTGGKGEKKAKKGKAQPVYKYYANYAMGLCQGPVDDVIRIWADNNLIYDKLNPDNEDLVGPGFSQRDEDTDGKGSQKSGAGKKGRDGESGRFAWRFYPGTETQMPDPYMVQMANEGAQSEYFRVVGPSGTPERQIAVPAYRDLAYLMFEDFALEDFGNRIPTITAEVTMKTERKSEVTRFENAPAPAGGFDQELSSIQIDIVRNRIFAIAKTPTDWVIRIWDMPTRKEINRLYFGENYPFESQVHGPRGEVITKAMVKKMVPIGMTHQGDIVMTAGGPNLKTINFFSGDTGAFISNWGMSGLGLSFPIDAAIFGPSFACPFVVSKTDGKPRGATMIKGGVGQPLYFFNDDYALSTMSFGHPSRPIVRPGAPGTDHAIVSAGSVLSGNYQYEFWKSSLDETIGDQMGPNTAKKFTVWPEVPFSNTSGGIITLSWFGFVVGAEAIGCIFTTTGGKVWAVKIDPYDGSILWQYQIPDSRAIAAMIGSGAFDSPEYVNTNVTSWATGGGGSGGTYHMRVDWRSEHVDIWTIANGTQPPRATASGGYYWSEKDALIYLTKSNPSQPGLTDIVIIYQDRKIQTGAEIKDIVTDVSIACDIPPERIRTERLVQTDKVIGYMFEQPMEGRSIIEELSNIFMFDTVESDHQLHFVSRNQSGVATITQEYLGVVEPPVGGENEYYVETRLNESELPRRATITYFNPKEDYEQATQIFNRPGKPIPVMGSNDALELSVNMALDADNARSMLTRILYAAWAERKQRTVRIPRDWMALDPTDVILIRLDNGEEWQGRITDISLGNNLEMEVSMVYQVPGVYSINVQSDTTRGPVIQYPSTLPAAEPIVFNIPYIEDADADEGAELSYYWGAAAHSIGFKYGVLQAQSQESELKVEGSTIKDLIWGSVKSGLGPPPAWNIEDLTTKIELIPAFNFNAGGEVFQWASIPDDEWPNDKNMLIIGGEIILFKDVEVHPITGVVTVSRLIRGHRGSIANAYLHHLPQSRKWALIFGEELRQSTEDFSMLNENQRWTVSTGNIGAALAMSQTLALDGATRKPLPVGDVRRTNIATGGGSIRINWSRATRFNGALKSGTGTIPLNEESEKYSVYLLKAPYDPTTWTPNDTSLYHTVKENLTTGQVAFTSTELGTFGLSLTSTLNVVIYQVSANVGLGYPHALALPYYYFGV